MSVYGSLKGVLESSFLLLMADHHHGLTFGNQLSNFITQSPNFSVPFLNPISAHCCFVISIGIEEFAVFKYAVSNHYIIGIDKHTLPVVFAILPSTNIFAPIGKDNGAKTISSISSSTQTGCRTPFTRRQTPALCWRQQQKCKTHQNRHQSFHSVMMTEFGKIEVRWWVRVLFLLSNQNILRYSRF